MIISTHKTLSKRTIVILDSSLSLDIIDNDFKEDLNNIIN